VTHATIIVAVGDELLGGFTADSNSHFAAGLLFRAGYPVRRIEVVGDRVEAIAEAVVRAVADGEIDRILVCGGIGPTPDDRTHQGVALGLGRPLEENPEALAHLQAIVSRMHRAGWVTTGEVNTAHRTMAAVVVGAEIIANRKGMAPAVTVALDAGRRLFVLPGVPREFQAILEEEIIPGFCGEGERPSVVEMRFPGAVEAEFATAMNSLAAEFPDVTVGSYPQTGTRELIIRLRGSDPLRVTACGARLQELRSGG